MIAYEICESDTIDSLCREEDRNTSNEERYRCQMCGKSISYDIYKKSIKKYGIPVCSGDCLERLKIFETRRNKID